MGESGAAKEMGEASTLTVRTRPPDRRTPGPETQSWMSRSGSLGRSLGILFCGGGVLTLISLALPRHFLDSPAYVTGVALVAVIIGAMLLRGALNQGAPSAFILMIAGANVLVSFGAYVSGNPMSGVELFYLWVTPYAYVLFSPLQAAMQTGIVAICWGLVLLGLDRQHGFASPGRLVANWVFTVVTVTAVGILVRLVSSSLRDVDRRFHRAFADSGIGAAFLSTDLRWLEVNEALCRILGYPSDELVGRLSSEIVDAQSRSWRLGDRPDRGRPGVEEDRKYRRSDGSTVWLTVTSTLVVPEAGASYVFAQYRDISDHRHVQEELGYQAAHDPLTGLANRAMLMQRLEAALENRAAKGTGVGRDPARSRPVQDHQRLLGPPRRRPGPHGYVAVVLQSACEPGDMLARLGGDEFVVLCEGLTGVTEALDRATRISQALSQTVELPSGNYSASASIGVAVATEPGDDGYGLLREADAAMYQAKADGRGRIELFNVAMREDADRRMRLARELEGAIADGQLLLEYQPTVELATGYPVIMEALVRWDHPERGRLSPYQFVPMADDTGLFSELGEWVLETACEEFSAWRRKDPIDPCPRLGQRLACPAGHAALYPADHRLVDSPIDLALASLPRDRRVAAFWTTRSCSSSMESLRSWGIEIVLDNFDTRHSSLDHLERLPIAMVKADRSVTARLAERPRQDAVIGAILTMADALGVVFVAGAVESEAQLERASRARLPLRAGQRRRTSHARE